MHFMENEPISADMINSQSKKIIKSVLKDAKNSRFNKRVNSTIEKPINLDQASLGKYGSMSSRGPSILLQESGSKSLVPRHEDYHSNLINLSKYSETGPGQYNLPSLFDNTSATKRNPMFSFR